MKNNNTQKTKYDLIRKNFFNLFSTNIKLLCKKNQWNIGFENEHGEFEELEEAFICPICLKLFNEESLNQSNLNPLTLEDAPPKKLGGRPITLTCKNCNNNLGGHVLDSKLIKNIEIEPFLKREPNSEIKVNYLINNRTKATGRLTFDEMKKFKFYINPNANPNFIKECDFFKTNGDKTNINFTFQIPNKKKVLLALLRIAHLKMFSVFGYGYILTPSSKIISQQLFEPDKDIIQDFGIPNINSIPYSKTGIHFIKTPLELSSFLVVFDIVFEGKKKTYSVLIPGPEKKCIEMYSKIHESKNYVMNIYSIPELDYLTDDRNILAYSEIWKYNLKINAR